MKAPFDGIIVGRAVMPIVNEGDAVFHIAFFAESDHLVEQQVETYIGEVLDGDDELLRAGFFQEPSSS